jgi:hypothetical protein
MPGEMALRRLLPCLLLVLAATPATTYADAWSILGGGPARAGHDAFDHGAPTNVIGSWSQTATAEQGIKAGPVISDGVPGTQRVVYGTHADDLHALLALAVLTASSSEKLADVAPILATATLAVVIVRLAVTLAENQRAWPRAAARRTRTR